MGLRPFAHWDCGFESSRAQGCLSLMGIVCCVTVLSGRALQDKNTPSTFSTEAKTGAIYLSERLGHSYQNTWLHNGEDQSAITYSVHFPYK